MDNLNIYNNVRSVPKEALKEIQAGRLRGKSDINPKWRLKTLTEQFGPCGIGWKYEITDKRLEPGGNGEIAAFVDINLYIKNNGEWSEAIPGTGGSSFVAQETKGPYTSDECFKMALTDAISVSCKALGFGADVYWEGDRTKYDQQQDPPKRDKSQNKASQEQVKELTALAKAKGLEKESYWNYLKKLHEDGEISNQYAMNKNKSILWTVEDYQAIKGDLELLC